MQHQPKKVEVCAVVRYRLPLTIGVRQSAHSPEAMKFKARGKAA